MWMLYTALFPNFTNHPNCVLYRTRKPTHVPHCCHFPEAPLTPLLQQLLRPCLSQSWCFGRPEGSQCTHHPSSQSVWCLLVLVLVCFWWPCYRSLLCFPQCPILGGTGYWVVTLMVRLPSKWLVRVVSARFQHSQVTICPFIINKDPVGSNVSLIIPRIRDF